MTYIGFAKHCTVQLETRSDNLEQVLIFYSLQESLVFLHNLSVMLGYNLGYPLSQNLIAELNHNTMTDTYMALGMNKSEKIGKVKQINTAQRVI